MILQKLQKLFQRVPSAEPSAPLKGSDDPSHQIVKVSVSKVTLQQFETLHADAIKVMKASTPVGFVVTTPGESLKNLRSQIDHLFNNWQYLNIASTSPDTMYQVLPADEEESILVGDMLCDGILIIEYEDTLADGQTRNHPVIDYTPYLERAAAEGTVTTRLSSIGLFGAAGTGKTSTARLLTDQEPVYEHDSTAVMKPEEYYKTTEDTDDTSDADEDSDLDSECEEPPVPRHCKVQQHARAAKQEVLIAKGGKINEWMPATEEVLIHRLGNCVATVAELEVGTTQGAESRCLFIDGFSMGKSKAISSVGGVKADASVTHHTDVSATIENPIACVSDLTQAILEFVKSKEDLQKLGITHFVSLCDTGGQAAYLDVAPSLLSFNSVNVVLFKLDESLDDPANFFYSVKGQTVGHEKRQITTRSLIRSMVSCKSKIMPPRIKGKLTEGSQYRKPVFMILGTHLDEYKKMEASGNCPQSKEEINATLKSDLSDFEDSLFSINGKTVFSLDTRARNHITKSFASKIRKKVMESYIQVEIPVSWYIFHLAMLKIKQSNKESYGMISLSALSSVGTVVIKMPPGEIQAVLQYFHDLRICLYYPTVASKVVFTDPQFLFDKISEIFALSQGEGKSRVNIGEFNKLTKYGKFNKSILGSICKGFSEIFSESEFLSLLCHLLVLSKIPDDTGDYFMPCVLAEHPNPCAEFFSSESSPSVEPLLFSWNSSVPNGLFTSLTTSIQAAEGVNNIHFTMSPSDEQYRNRITLNCPDFGFKVRLIECTTFVAVAALVAHSEEIAKQCVKLRRVIFSCIGKIAEQFHWMPLLAYPQEVFLCKIEQCISQDDIHFCLLDVSHRVVSCAKDSSIRAPTQADSHLVWWGQIGSSLDHSNQLSTLNMFNLLQDKSAKWDKIGRAFGSSANYRETLLRNPALDDDQRLEAVLNKWLESTSDPTWAQFYSILIDSLKFNDVAKRVKVRLIECTTFVAVAALVAHSEEIAKQCVKLRRVIFSCIGKIAEQFRWMPLLAFPEELFLCKIEQCILQDDIHFCHLDGLRSVVSCAKDSSVRAPVQADSHLVWWTQEGDNPGDPSQSIHTAVIKALDTRLDLLSYAAAGSIDALSTKLYAKSLIPEPVKDDPTKSFDILLKCFKACIKLEQSPGNVTRKTRDFITALEEIGGGLATAADAIRKDINKELGSTSPFMTDHIETSDTFEGFDRDEQSESSPSITVDKSATAEDKKQSQSSYRPEIENKAEEVRTEQSRRRCNLF